MSNPTTPFSWQMPTATDLVTDLPADFEVFGQAVATSMADLLGGTTGQVLSKTTSADMDFTWVTTDDANAIQNSIVDAKGDIVAASANDTPARLAVGNNGEGLVADSTAATGLRWQGNYAGGKNFVINGNQNVSQRGTSFTSNASNVNIYTTDRWNARNSALGEYTITQETDAPAGFGASAKWLCTTADASPAASDFLIYRTILEGQTLQALQFASATAQTTTLSFWVKSNVTGTYIATLSNSGRQICASYTILASATWEKKTITFAGDTVGTIANTTAASVNMNFYLGAGTDRTSGTLQTTWATTVNANTAVGQTNLASAINNYWQITGVQWEIGNTGTSFQLASGTVPGELAACQRYYYRNTGTSLYSYFAGGSALSTTAASVLLTLPVQMRVKPTSLDSGNVRLSDLVSGFTIGSLTLSTDGNSPNVATLDATGASGLTQFRPLYLGANNNTAGYVGVSAEL